jgi:hypothetical protein
VEYRYAIVFKLNRDPQGRMRLVAVIMKILRYLHFHA